MDLEAWVRAGHIISVIAWMAGMLYLPRLFVYHCQVAVGSESSELFKVMEKRLLRIIINPAMIATWGFGLWLIYLNKPYAVGWWFYVKFALVFLLSGYHGMLTRWMKDFAADQNGRSERYYRLMNEVPAVIMVFVVCLVVVKPF